MDAKWVFRRSHKKRDVQTNISEKLGYKDSNLENDGVRVRCLTIWR